MQICHTSVVAPADTVSQLHKYISTCSSEAQYRISSTIASGGHVQFASWQMLDLAIEEAKSPGRWPLLKPHGRC